MLPRAMEPTLVPYAIGVLAGFAIGTFGHVIKSRGLIAAGIAIIFAVAVLLPLLRVGDPS